MVETNRFGDVPMLDVAGSYDAESGNGALFLVNRSQNESVAAQLNWQGLAPSTVGEVWRLSGTDVKAANTFAHPDTLVARQVAAPPVNEGTAELELPPLSFTAISVRY